MEKCKCHCHCEIKGVFCGKVAWSHVYNSSCKHCKTETELYIEGAIAAGD